MQQLNYSRMIKTNKPSGIFLNLLGSSCCVSHATGVTHDQSIAPTTQRLTEKLVPRFHQQTWDKFLLQQKQGRNFKKAHNQLEDFLSGISLSADIIPPAPLSGC